MTTITRALSAALLHFVWQGLVVTILLWLALFLLRKRSAALRYGASCAALALLVALPAITTWELYQRPAAAPGGTALLVETLGAATLTPAGGGLDWLALAQTWAVPVWSLGVLLFSLRMAWGCTQITAMRRAGEAADAQLRAMFAELAGRMGVTRPVRLLLSSVTDSPSLTGWLRPVVLLPLSAAAGLTPDQLEAVLAHELAHIRRHDYLVNLLQMAAETLLFYHPAVWWISGRIRHERELCCDDLAVSTCGGALTYARALTALEKMRGPRPALALGSTDGPLLYRIRRLAMGGGEYGPSKLSGTIALTLGMACLALWANWARAQEPRRPEIVVGEGVQDSDGVTVNTAGATLLHRPSIEYPGALLEKHVQGTVSVEATLDATGNVVDAHVLSGPEELRKVALSSVLNWHFSPTGSGNTRVVQISFQTPATASQPAAEAQAREEGAGRVRVTTRSAQGETQTVRTDRATQENLAAAQETLAAEQHQTALTVNFLKEDLARAQERLGDLESQPGATAGQIEEARAKLVELRRRLEEAQVASAQSEPTEHVMDGRLHLFERMQASRENPGSTDDNPEPRAQAERFERLVAEGKAKRVGRKLSAIEIRGLSDEAGRDLLSRLPLHEGDTLSTESTEAAARVIRQFDEHLEFNFNPGLAGVVLRIHPAGGALAPLLRK